MGLKKVKEENDFKIHFVADAKKKKAPPYNIPFLRRCRIQFTCLTNNPFSKRTQDLIQLFIRTFVPGCQRCLLMTDVLRRVYCRQEVLQLVENKLTPGSSAVT